MHCLNVPPKYSLPPLGSRAYAIATSNHGKVVRSRKGKRQRKSRKQTRLPIYMGGITWGKWRRLWSALIYRMWKNTLSPTDRAWWTTQAVDFPRANYYGDAITWTGFKLYGMYQMSRFDVHLDRYIPFDQNKADFWQHFTPPWDPPTLEAPTILSALNNGLVTVRALNVTPGGLLIEPFSRFDIMPNVVLGDRMESHPWYWYAKTDDGIHTNYYYDLSTIYPRLHHGTRAVLKHCYANPHGGLQHSIGTPTLAENEAYAGNPWSNPMTICNYDANYPEAILDGDLGHNLSDYLICSEIEWDHAIPATAVITRIDVQLMQSQSGTPNVIRTSKMHVVKAGVKSTLTVGSPYWPVDQTFPWSYYLYNPGGAQVLWGLPWVGADFADPDFGCAFYVSRTTGTGAPAARPPHVKITVYYTGPDGWFTDPTLTPFVFS